jgi:hypothetical protein
MAGRYLCAFWTNDHPLMFARLDTRSPTHWEYIALKADFILPKPAVEPEPFPEMMDPDLALEMLA